MEEIVLKEPETRRLDAGGLKLRATNW